MFEKNRMIGTGVRYRKMGKIVVLSTGILFLLAPVASAVVLLDGEHETFVRTIKCDFNGDGIRETVTLEPRGVEDHVMTDFDLKVISEKKTILFRGASKADSPNLCGVTVIMLSQKKNPFIGVIYDCGAHSAGLELYSFDGKLLEKVGEIGSDGPFIELKDVDGDGDNEIVSENRDYSHNPIEDHFIETYKYDGKKWDLISVYETRVKEYFSPELLTKWKKEARHGE